MKIGLARRGYSSTGGAENYLRRLADALEIAGHVPVLFASPDWPRDQWPANRELISIPGRSPAAFADHLAALQPKERCDRLFSLERVWQCDCYRAGDGVHRAWLERRALAEPWWQPLLRRFNAKHRQILALETHLYAQEGARQIIANSELVRREIVDDYGTPAGRITVIYNGLPSEHFHPCSVDDRAQTRSNFGLQPDDYAILFAGTGWERKGLAHVIQAVGKLSGQPRPVLLVAGRGNPRRYLRSLAKIHRDRLRFLGPVKEMRALYAAADVFVAPTLYDPFSNACLEALAAGLPVLTTHANGFSEIITSGVHGDVFDAADQAQAEELTSLLTAWADPDRRAMARPICALRAQEFTIEVNVSRTLDILLR